MQVFAVDLGTRRESLMQLNRKILKVESKRFFWKPSTCCALVQSDIYNEILRKFRDISAFFLLYKHSYEQLL